MAALKTQLQREYQPRKAGAEFKRLDDAHQHIAGYFKFSKRLIVVAVAVALRRGEVAIFAVVVFGRRRRRFPRFVVFLRRFIFGRLMISTGSTHVISSGQVKSRACDLNLTAFVAVY
jgi:hypothetical protein